MRDIKKSFREKKVLNGVTGTIQKGRVVGIMGRNGEGKTTLLKILMDMLSPDSGTSEILGHKPDGSGFIRQIAGYVPETPVFHNFMKISEVMDLRSRFFRNWDKEKATELTKQLELNPDAQIKGSSKGMLGKLAWICAVAHNPEILLLDEPTAGLDALVRDNVLRNLIEELQNRGTTVLVTNHHMEEMAGILDELWILSGGVIAGTYDMQKLREESCVVTGRLKQGKTLPRIPETLDISEKDMPSQIAVFNSVALKELAASDVFENMMQTPLQTDTTLKLLLKLKGGSHD